jgi:ABC-type lipoprotein release transport system permease subunit
VGHQPGWWPANLSVRVDFGWLSWLLAIPSVFRRAVDYQDLPGLHLELVYQVSQMEVWSWFVIITILAIIASWFPAQKAAQTSVRESLAYV